MCVPIPIQLLHDSVPGHNISQSTIWSLSVDLVSNDIKASEVPEPGANAIDEVIARMALFVWCLETHPFLSPEQDILLRWCRASHFIVNILLDD